MTESQNDHCDIMAEPIEFTSLLDIELKVKNQFIKWYLKC